MLDDVACGDGDGNSVMGGDRWVKPNVDVDVNDDVEYARAEIYRESGKPKFVMMMRVANTKRYDVRLNGRVREAIEDASAGR